MNGRTFFKKKKHEKIVGKYKIQHADGERIRASKRKEGYGPEATAYLLILN
jgi:hypothetical protein